jgi:hypothetical protein
MRAFSPWLREATAPVFTCCPRAAGQGRALFNEDADMQRTPDPQDAPMPDGDVPGSAPHPMHDPMPDRPIDPPVPTPGDPERDPQPQRDPPSPTRPQDPPRPA